MRHERVKSTVAIVLVGTYALTCMTLVLVPLLFGDDVEKYADMLKTFSSVFSGVVGLIVGHYFTSRPDA